MAHLKVLVFTVFLAVQQITGTPCCISRNHLENEWRLALAYKDDDLHLLREMQVKNGTVLYMVCNDVDTIEVTCQDGQFNPPMPLPFCGMPLQPQLKLENNRSLCDYELFHVGFNIKCKDNNYFFPTYKVCFDMENMRSVFTINEAYPFVKARPRDMRFDPDEIFKMQVFAAYNKRSIFSRFQNLLGSQQRFMAGNEGDRRIDRGHLTPVADFFMNTLIKSTFKMINVIPQFHTINDGNWKQMEEWARSPFNTPSKVCSGALPWVLELPNSENSDIPMYLHANKIPIPLWTFKVVLNCHEIRTVFLQYNNIHDTNGSPQIPNNICNVVQCPSSIKLRNNNLYGYTYCCEERHFMTNVVPKLQGHC